MEPTYITLHIERKISDGNYGSYTASMTLGRVTAHTPDEEIADLIGHKGDIAFGILEAKIMSRLDEWKRDERLWEEKRREHARTVLYEDAPSDPAPEDDCNLPQLTNGATLYTEDGDTLYTEDGDTLYPEDGFVSNPTPQTHGWTGVIYSPGDVGDDRHDMNIRAQIAFARLFARNRHQRLDTALAIWQQSYMIGGGPEPPDALLSFSDIPNEVLAMLIMWAESAVQVELT